MFNYVGGENIIRCPRAPKLNPLGMDVPEVQNASVVLLYSVEFFTSVETVLRTTTKKIFFKKYTYI